MVVQIQNSTNSNDVAVETPLRVADSEGGRGLNMHGA